MDFYSAAQHLLGAAFAAVGGTPYGGVPPWCCINAALPDLHHLQHDASRCIVLLMLHV
jgi:hypothetical protein